MLEYIELKAYKMYRYSKIKVEEVNNEYIVILIP